MAKKLKKLVKKILIEEKSSDTVQVYKKTWEEVLDKPAPKKAAPKAVKAKAEIKPKAKSKAVEAVKKVLSTKKKE